jgi:hypothetical protein
MRLSPLLLTFLLEVCLIGLASFLGPFLLWDFLEILFQRGECGTKASLWLKLTSDFKNTYKWFKGYKTKGENVNMKIKKGEV